jgi:hypothetical protein
MLETIDEQREALAAPIDSKFVKNDTNVKGPYSTGDYVVWKLNEIFGPDNWKHTIQAGPELITNNDQNAYAQVTIRLTVQFANGEQVTHDDVGIWPFKATRGQTLEGTAPERYETVIKASVTDGIKACVEYLGICFRPMADENLRKHIVGQIRAAGKKEQPSSRGEAPRAVAQVSEPEATEEPASLRLEQPDPQPASAQPGNGNSHASLAASGQPSETPEEYFAIRPKGPRDWTTYYTISVPAFVDEDGDSIETVQAADILKSQNEDALKAFDILTKRFTRKEG